MCVCVCECVCVCLCVIIHLFIHLFVISDIDECVEKKGRCGENATCTNLQPGYKCICKRGFVQRGIFCIG